MATPDTTDTHDDETPSAFARRVGDRMRAIRRQRGLSLHDVERISDDEFKGSVVGAYERGERAISVSRLERLAALYQVPVDQFLPRDESRRSADRPDRTDRSIVIDMSRLSDLVGEPFESLARFVRSVQVQRSEVARRMVRLRAEDGRAIAAMLDAPVEQVIARLEALDIMPRDPSAAGP